jgi:O-antigen/teichoic acid export membrane protein
LSEHSQRRFAVARLVGSAVVSQALLSAANFIISLILIRSTSDIQYSYFILASNAILLLISLQNAFFNPPLAIRMSRLDRLGRGELVGGLYREQRRILPIAAVLALCTTVGLWSGGALNANTGPLVLITIVATLTILHREYFRMVLFAYRRTFDVLRADICYVLLAVFGATCAVWTHAPEVATIFALCIAALASGVWLSRTLHRHEPWNFKAKQHILREIAPLAVWSTTGAAIHWTFSQGYIYLVVAALNVPAVAAIAATRLLLMPVNLLSAGVGSVMLPLSAQWLHQRGARPVWHRLQILALGLAVTTLCYFCALWFLRDWIFSVVLKKEFVQRDELLLLWGAIFFLTTVRDQLGYLLAAQGRFRGLTLLTLGSAIASLAISYHEMLRVGVTGALIGILVGELINVAGIVILSLRHRADEVVVQV